jgi:hypothetical protein
MGIKITKSKKGEIPITVQARKILEVFPESNVKFEGTRKLHWVGKLKPTPLSYTYTISLLLNMGKVEVYVMDPEKLDKPNGHKFLKHVYSTPRQKLCLFFPNGEQWNGSKLLINTIIPWACEWLYFYEIWLLTGDWLGRGTVHDFEESQKAA